VTTNAHTISQKPASEGSSELSDFLESERGDLDSCIDVDSEKDKQVLGTANLAREHNTPSVIVVIPSSPKWFSPQHRSGLEKTEPDLTLTPQTLSEFQKWWNSLVDGNRAVAIPVAILNRGLGDIGLADSMTLSEKGKVSVKAVESVRLEISPSSDGGFEAVADSPKANNSFRFQSCAQYEIPVKQQGLLKFFPNWQTGTFRASFYDLDEATREYGTLPWNRVSKLVSDENTKGPEVFEAFGMKFPAGQITLWGDILLLSVQLYFLVYLRQLSGKLKPDDAGWDVPWIGMNSAL
jgi:hypothetical protein